MKGKPFVTARVLKIVIPVLLVAAGAVGAWKIIESRPEIQTEAVAPVIPTVRTVVVKPESLRLSVQSQGTVSARTVTDLIPQVSGRVIYVSSSMVAGGFFAKDEVLLRLEQKDYELALINARSAVAQAELRLQQEAAEAEVAAAEWEKLGNEEEATPLVLRKPQVVQASASVEAARAMLEQAALDLERTEIKAPFDGRVRRESVDVGQFVSRGSPLAQLYSIDVAEVRLPLSSDELAYVDLPLEYRNENGPEAEGPAVLLRSDWAGEEYTWRGRIARTEGEIDEATRMLYVVAEVRDPYARGADAKRPPLAVGMFVRAEILGKRLSDAIVLPRSAVRNSDTVYVVDSDERLRIRGVDVFKRERERVILRSGLAGGEKVCISPMEAVVDGMAVQVSREEDRP